VTVTRGRRQGSSERSVALGRGCCPNCAMLLSMVCPDGLAAISFSSPWTWRKWMSA